MRHGVQPNAFRSQSSTFGGLGSYSTRRHSLSMPRRSLTATGRESQLIDACGRRKCGDFQTNAIRRHWNFRVTRGIRSGMPRIFGSSKRVGKDMQYIGTIRVKLGRFCRSAVITGISCIAGKDGMLASLFVVDCRFFRSAVFRLQRVRKGSTTTTHVSGFLWIILCGLCISMNCGSRSHIVHASTHDGHVKETIIR